MNQSDLIVKARDIASHMKGWRYNDVVTSRESHYHACVTMTNGFKAFTIRKCWRDNNRLSVSGVYPDNRRPSRSHSIGMSYTRTGKSLAGDITRRFIPKFIELHE